MSFFMVANLTSCHLILYSPQLCYFFLATHVTIQHSTNYINYIVFINTLEGTLVLMLMEAATHDISASMRMMDSVWICLLTPFGSVMPVSAWLLDKVQETLCSLSQTWSQSSQGSILLSKANAKTQQ